MEDSFDDVVDARKNRFDDKAAWKLLADAKSITVAKGKKVRSFSPASDNKEDILKAVMGPSGNLRAPALRKGKDWTIGFHPEVYEKF